MEFYICPHCGNIVAYVRASGVSVVCCGQKVERLTANTTDASREKHVPVITVDGGKVTVNIGSADHPMVEEHHIEWVALHSKQGNQRKELAAGGAPKAEFLMLPGDEVIAVYAYCNLHGLWMKEYFAGE